MKNKNSKNKIWPPSRLEIFAGIGIFLLIIALFIPHITKLIFRECPHNYVPVFSMAVSCEDGGFSQMKCALCGRTVEETVSALGHIYKEQKIPPSCTEDGKIMQICERCGDEYLVEEIGASGHNYKEIVVDATCLENGSITRICSVCEDINTEIIPASGHSFKETVIAPTCAREGRVDYRCDCGEQLESKILLKKGHDYVEGFCSICGKEEVYKESLGIFRITAYCPCRACSGRWGSQTSSGRTAQANYTIAVDKSIIPYFTEISINEHIYVAEDTGGAIKGNRIDIFFNTHEEAVAFGVQYIEVYKITHPQNQKEIENEYN